MSTPYAEPVPPGRTARRLQWAHLPPAVRALVAQRCGSPVVRARSRDAGFTPGLASVLTCEDGSRHFVKAASVKAQRLIAESYREEARKLAHLPASVPAPRLRWSHDDGEWIVLGIEHVAGRPPARPWLTGELGRVLDTLAAMAADLTPPPPGLALTTVAEEFASLVPMQDALADRAHAAAARSLAERALTVMGGDTLVHTDVRDDNLLLGRDGRVWVCDWNWPVRGAAWLDSLFLLIQARGDGLDVEALLDRPLLAGVAADDVDAVLALLSGYFAHQSAQPTPPTSPYLRQHQRWMGEATWGWLAERRGWR